MHVELVEITTEDEVALPGAYLAPAADAAPRERAVDAVVLNPGTGGSFHSRVLLGIGAALAEAGYGALTMSTRGHDIAWRHAAGRRYLGSAFESIADCALDFRGACDLLAARGHTRLALLGHSLGGTKALYHAAHDPDPRLAIGQAVSLRIFVSAAIEAVAVPASAIVDDAGQPVVFVQVAGERFERRAIELGNRESGLVQITGDVALGERIVVRGAPLIRLAALSPQVPAHGHTH